MTGLIQYNRIQSNSLRYLKAIMLFPQLNNHYNFTFSRDVDIFS